MHFSCVNWDHADGQEDSDGSAGVNFDDDDSSTGDGPPPLVRGTRALGGKPSDAFAKELTADAIPASARAPRTSIDIGEHLSA